MGGREKTKKQMRVLFLSKREAMGREENGLEEKRKDENKLEEREEETRGCRRQKVTSSRPLL